MTFRAFQPNFSRGELAPELYGRFDTDAWNAGIKLGKNVIILKYGGLTKRPGTQLVAEVISGTTQRLVPFQFSLEQSYALEFGNGYMAPCALGGRVGSNYSISSPYSGAQLAEIDFEQTADTMYLAHLSHPPRKLLRAGHTSWSFASVTFGPTVEGPASCTAVNTTPNVDDDNDGTNFFPQPASYCVTAFDDDTGQESRASTSSTCTNDLTLKRNYNTVTWDATGATRYNVYKAENSQFFGYIGTTEATTFRDDNIGPALDQAPPEAYNPFPGAGDYPSTVTLFEQRSVWARSSKVPNGVWASRSGQLENMDRSRPLREDDSLSFTIVAGRVNSVNQLVSTTGLLGLTSDGVFSIDGDGKGGILAGDSPPAARRQIGRGSSRLPPLVVDNVIFYTPSVGCALRSVNYSFEVDGLKSNDLTIFSPHFFEGFDIVSWAYAQEPRSLIWAVRSDGVLLCFTWEQEQNVWGWTQCETDGLVKSVCSISEQGEDRVYLIVERKWGATTKRFVERMVPHRWDDVADTCFLDCAISAEFSTPQSTFSGLAHLNGRTDVAGIVDGVVVTGLTVSGGQVTLPASVGSGKKVSFGIPYSVDVELLPVKASVEGLGSTVGRKQQAGDLVLTLQDTCSIEAGIDADHLYLVKSRTSEAYASPDDLMNGDYVVTSEGKAGTAIGCYIRQTVPLPFTLLGAGRDMILHE